MIKNEISCYFPHKKGITPSSLSKKTMICKKIVKIFAIISTIFPKFAAPYEK